MIAVILTVQVNSPWPTDIYVLLLEIVVKPLISIAMIGIGVTMIFKAMWQTSASAERREAVSKAIQQELLNEIRQRRGDLPNVPSKKNSPRNGTRLPFRIIASRRSLWGVVTAGVLCLAFVIVGTILLVTAYVKLKMGRDEWLAAGLLVIPISFAAVWSFYRFLKQFLKTTSLGPSIVELQEYPLVAGNKNKVFLSQSGRRRLKLIDVHLVCLEEATFNEGTTSMTKQAIVYEHRLFRKRGVELVADQPFESEFPIEIPAGAMHSFQSSSNRITWQLEIHGKTTGFPNVVRNFEIIVIPATDTKNRMQPV